MKLSRLLLASFLLAAATLLPTTYAAAVLPPAVNNQVLPSLAPMLQKILPAVVNISVVGQVNIGNPFANSNGPQSGPNKFATLGSGVIIDAKKGYILTNAHVIRYASAVTVSLSDGRQYNAKIIGVDTPSDVAVLQINAQNLTSIPVANSDNLKVGDFVVAVGNPFGLNQTVTSGIVSALQRTGLGIEGYENFIQTDAPINPGNSGGALVNLSGQLIGINTAILAPDGANIGIGFAIPSNMAQSVMLQLIKYGSVRRGLLGIMIQTLSPGLADAFKLPNQTGALVAEVNPNSPAAKAGLRPGDVILGVNGQKINDAAQVTNIVGLIRVDSPVSLAILRNGKIIKTQVIIASPNQYLAETRALDPLLFGINMRDFGQVTALHGNVVGVQITGIAEESPAWHASPIGLRPGDIITTANMKPIRNIGDLMVIAKASNELVLNILRGDAAMFVVVK